MAEDKNQHIESYLDYYRALGADPGFAILIRGKWGSGKSWYIKKYIKENLEGQVLYISLYGVTKYKDIEDAFFNNCIH